MTNAFLIIRTTVTPADVVLEHMRTLAPSAAFIGFQGPRFAHVHVKGVMLSRLLPALIIYQDAIAEMQTNDFEYTED